MLKNDFSEPLSLATVAEAVPQPSDAIRRADLNGKANLAPRADKSDWFRLRSVSLGNDSGGHFDDSDHVQVVETWEWPDMMEAVTVAHLRETQRLVKDGEWRDAIQSKERWVGVAVAQAMGLDWQNRGHRSTISTALATWYATGMLVKVRRPDNHREERTFVEVGEPATP